MPSGEFADGSDSDVIAEQISREFIPGLRVGKLGVVIPGTTPDDAFGAISFRADRCITGCPFMVGVPAVGCPFPDIAVHVMDAPGIGGKRTNRS